MILLLLNCLIMYINFLLLLYNPLMLIDAIKKKLHPSDDVFTVVQVMI